jgi:Ran GTPase-activating protein (RanGAP) involved in mRNA processing and transport
MQALCLEGNTIGVDAAKAIAEALSKRPEFEVIMPSYSQHCSYSRLYIYWSRKFQDSTSQFPQELKVIQIWNLKL